MSMVREIRGALAQGCLTTLARPRNALLTIAGFLVAGATLLGLLTIPAGLGRLAGHTGLPDVAVVLTGHDMSEAAGGMNDAEKIALIGNLPGVAHDQAGRALVAPQFVVSTKLRRFSGVQSDVMIRGVSPVFWRVVGDGVRLTEGHLFKPGVHQLVAGTGAAKGFVALGTGAHVLIRKTPWQVTGQFNAGGSLWGSELWTSIGSLQSAWNAPGRVTSLWVKLTSPAAFGAFSAALKSNRSLQGLHAQRQTDYYRWQIGFIYRYTQIAAWGISILLGMAAILAIANALNMALTARRRETAVLRAVGFRQSSLAVAMLLEVTVIGVVCSCIVIVLGWLVLNGRTISSATFFQSIDFPLHVGPAVALSTILYTVVLAIIAAFWPIARAVRAPLTRALQDE